MFNDNLRIFGGYHDFVYINDMIRFIDILLKKTINSMMEKSLTLEVESNIVITKY